MQHVFGFSRKQNPVLHELLHESLFPCSGGRGKSWTTHKVSDVFMRLSESLHQGLLMVFDAEIQHTKYLVGSMAYFSTISFLSQIHPNLYFPGQKGAHPLLQKLYSHEGPAWARDIIGELGEYD